MYCFEMCFHLSPLPPCLSPLFHPPPFSFPSLPPPPGVEVEEEEIFVSSSQIDRKRFFLISVLPPLPHYFRTTTHGKVQQVPPTLKSTFFSKLALRDYTKFSHQRAVFWGLGSCLPTQQFLCISPFVPCGAPK